MFYFTDLHCYNCLVSKFKAESKNKLLKRAILPNII